MTPESWKSDNKWRSYSPRKCNKLVLRYGPLKIFKRTDTWREWHVWITIGRPVRCHTLSIQFISSHFCLHAACLYEVLTPLGPQSLPLRHGDDRKPKRYTQMGNRSQIPQGVTGGRDACNLTHSQLHTGAPSYYFQRPAPGSTLSPNKARYHTPPERKLFSSK